MGETPGTGDCVIDVEGTLAEADAIQFIRCLGCGEPLHNDDSRRLGAGPACRARLGDEELARRRECVLASERVHHWVRATAAR